ncbi:MAG TPA: hypothetical protein VGQ83_35570 [Polyangia bacterium]|jgi:hypothetical protein
MSKRTMLAFLVGAVALGPSPAARADVPRVINFQGRLADKTGTPVTSTGYTITFAVFDTDASGAACHSETRVLPVTSGLFSVRIGEVGGLNSACDFAKPYWLEVQVAGDAPLSPRLQLTPAVYAFSAGGLVANGVPPGTGGSMLRTVGNGAGQVPRNSGQGVVNVNLNCSYLGGNNLLAVGAVASRPLYVLHPGCTNASGDLTSEPTCTTYLSGASCSTGFDRPAECVTIGCVEIEAMNCNYGNYRRRLCRCTNTGPVAYVRPAP